MKAPSNWPVIVKIGSATVKIYRVARVKAGTEYIEYRVGYYDAEGKRRFESFSEYADAEAKARKVGASITRGDAKGLSLSAEDALVYLRAVERLKATGTPLDVAVADYVTAKEILPGHSLTEAAKFFAKSCADLKTATVRSVVDELVASKEKRAKGGKPASAEYLRDLKSRLGRFADALQCDIASVRSQQIEAFMDSMQISERSRFNWLRLIKTLFNYAQARRYFPRDIDPMEGIDMDFEDGSEIEIFTPAEMRRLLSAACPEMVPFLAIGAFAGLRSAEIGRLDWSDIKPGFIEVTKGKAKTRSRRLVPIQPNLAAWLAPHRQESGPVVLYSSLSKQIGWVCDDTADKEKGLAPVKWKHNALRHSFISYRMAMVKNEHTVAGEAGNSPQMIYGHYRELVTEAQAAEWFGIVPATMASNVVPMKVA